MEKTCTYKGRKYILKFCGETKFGRRAKLAFLDGSKEFWVSADLISQGEPAAVVTASKPTASRRDRGCPECGKNRRLIYDNEDGGMKCFECCDMPSE